MSTNKILVISNNKKLYSKKDKKLFLNLNCFHEDISKNIFKGNFFKNNIIKPCMNKKSYSNNSRQIEKMIISVSKSLRKVLNNFHKENKSQRFWEILFANWLKTFASIVGEKYFNILEAKNNYKFDKIIISNNKFINQNINNSDLENNTANDAWNFELYSEIIKELNFPKSKIKYDFKYEQKKSLNTKKNNNFEKFFNKNFLKLSNSLLSKNHSMIYDTSLDKFSKMKIHLNLSQLPNLPLKLQINYKQFNEAVRCKLDLNYKKYSGLERIFRKVLPLSLPTAIIENYSKLNKSINDLSFPKKPRLIFTSSEYNNNDLFRFFAAKNISNKTKYIIAQHGNNYFSLKDYKYLFPEVKYSDFFISWGSIYKDKKVIKLFNILNLNYKKTNLKKNKIFVFFKPIPKMKIWPWDNYYETFKNYYLSGELIRNLNSNLKKKITFRFKYKNNKLNILKKFVDNISGYKLDQNTIQKNSLLNSSKLIIFTYESTGLYEALSLDIPCVCLISKPIYFYTKKTQKIFQEMIKANIFFTNPKLMARHINKNENYIDHWWKSKRVLKAKKVFKYNLSSPIGDDPYTKFSNLLLKLSN